MQLAKLNTLRAHLAFARAAVFFFFMIEGYYNAIWSVYLPLQQEELGISDGMTGAASLFNYGGQVVSTFATAPLLRWVGARNSVLAGALMFCCSMFFIPLAHTFSELCVVFAIFGTTEGVMDVSMNANAVLTEAVAGRPLLGAYHGSYSVAAAIGGLIGGAFVNRGVDQQVAYSASGGIGIAFTLLSFLQLYSINEEVELTAESNDKIPKTTTSNSQTPSVNNYSGLASVSGSSEVGASASMPMPNMMMESTDKQITSESIPGENASPLGALAALAAVGFLAAAGEGAVVTWVTIWFTRSFSSAPGGLFSIGFTSFMSCMALGRFCCDSLRQLIGRRTMFKIAGLLACVGVCIIALAPSMLPEPSSLYVSCFGCSVTGLGLSTLIPTVFSSAGHLPNVHPGTAISRVAFFTYAGSIVSPPLIGALSDAFQSLQLGFIVLAVMLALITPLGSKVPPESPRATNTPGDHSQSDHESENLHTPLLPK